MNPEYNQKGDLVVYISENKNGKAEYISFDEGKAMKKGFPVRVRYIKDE